MMKKKVIAKIETFNVGEHFCNMAVSDLDKKIFSIKFGRNDIKDYEVGKAYLFEVEVEDINDKISHTLISSKLIEDALEGEELSDALLKLYDYAPLNQKELKKGIESYLDKIENKNLKLITEEVYKKYKNKLYVHPAATKFHHAYVGGLAHHTLSMLNLVDPFIKQYKYLNKDLLYSGIILHDLAKIEEITGVDGEYTKEGILLGHLVMIAIDIEKAAIKHNLEDSEEVMLLKHIAVSHHGIPNFGSPKKPQIGEALLIWYLDTIDSKLGPLGDELEKTESGEFTSNVAVLDRMRFYKDKLWK